MPSLFERLDRAARPRGHLFFGWWIVGSAGGVQMLAALLWMQSYGAYMVLLQEEFGWSKTLVAGAFALTRVESGILGPLQGWLVDRYGPRLILSIGTVMFGIGFMLFSTVDSVVTFYLTFFLVALGSSLGGFATLMVAIVNWFDRHRAKAVALSQLGFSLGGLAVPLLVLALEGLGWRTTALVSGCLVIAVGLPLVQVVRHRPQDHGEVPDGSPADPVTPGPGRLPEEAAARGTVPVAAPAAGTSDFTVRQALRTRAFWLISLGHALALLTVSAVLVHLIPHLTGSLDYSLTGAGAVVALMTLCQLFGQLAGGFLGDRFDKRLICAGCMIAHCVGLLLVTFASSSPMVIAFAVLHGLGWGMRGPLMVALRADYFGAGSFGTIMGFSSLIVMLGMSGGPIVAGILADMTGTYELGFSVLAACAVVGSVCFLAATRPPHPEPALPPSAAMVRAPGRSAAG